MPLTDVAIRNAKPRDKTYKISDGGGLQLWVYPDGAKRWRLAYRFLGAPKTISLGIYPVTGLKDAREGRDAAKKQLASGTNPADAKRAAKIAKALAAGATFDLIADEVIERARREKKAVGTVKRLEWILTLARPAIGPRPIAEITAAEVLVVLRKVERRGHYETAKRLRSTIGKVFRYAVATVRADHDPTGVLRDALTAPIATPRAAIVDPTAFGELLRAISAYRGSYETRAALELLALTFVRPGELRAMEWAELDLNKAVWTIPAAKMKMRRPHLVPLAPRAVTILEELSAVARSPRFVFPTTRGKDRPMSDNTINAALRRLGYDTSKEHCAHGFRSSASTLINQSKLFHPDAVERQLAHADQNAIKGVYDRAEHWEERVKMMRWWADHCLELREAVKNKKKRKSSASSARSSIGQGDSNALPDLTTNERERFDHG